MDRLDEIHADVKEIKADVKVINVQTLINTENLKAHMARTLANEERIKLVEGSILAFMGAVALALFVHYLG